MFNPHFTPLNIITKSVFILSIFIGSFSFFAMANPSKDTTSTDLNEGIYRRITVSTFEQCQAQCSADRLCRGSRADQPDTRHAVMHCKLYDGTGNLSPFPNETPPALNLDQAVNDLNQYRAQYGLNPVRLQPVLSQASQIHADDLAAHDNISHDGSDGSTHADRVERLGYSFALVAENVATGQKSWPEVFQAWKDSPGHNVNLLQKNTTEFGLALKYDPQTGYQTFWAMLMGQPLSDLQ